MAEVELGVILGEPGRLKAGRRSDPVTWVIHRGSLLDPPRAAGARALAESTQRAHPGARLGLYAWRHVTHGASDSLPEGTRKMPGEPARCGHLQASDEVAHAWEVTRIAAEGLGADQVVLKTPPSFTPGSLGRRRLEQFVAGRKAEDPQLSLVWEPEGLWEPDSAHALAQHLEITVLLPAFRPDGAVELLPGAWLKVDGLGSGGRFTGAHAEELAEQLLERELDAPSDGPLVVLFGGMEPHRGVRAFERAVLSAGEPLELARPGGDAA